MVKVKEDLTGKFFGKLKVLRQIDDYISPNTGRHYAQWLCECDCDNHTKVIVQQNHLKSRHTSSCGCLQKEQTTKANKYNLFDDCGVLWTSNTNEKVYFDLNDAEKVLQYCWLKDCEGYPSATIEGKRIRLYVFLGLKWHDHKNRNKLDNRRKNLRPCNYNQNDMNKGLRRDNTSGVIGVYWFDRNKKWKAQINIDGKTKNLGTYINKDEAIKSRLVAEAEHYKEFAPQHYLFEKYGVKHEKD
jgi:hypothetical protein